jgi:hypothetical protein
MHGKLDRDQKESLEPSWASQLDVVGMQPHAREYVEGEVNCMRTRYCFNDISGQSIDYTQGIQFSGKP